MSFSTSFLASRFALGSFSVALSLLVACGGTVSATEESASKGGNAGSPGHGGAAGTLTPSCSGAPDTFAPAQAPWTLAIDSTHLYWGDDLDDFSHLLMRRPLNGGDLELVYHAPGRIEDLAIDDASVYLASGTSEVVRIAKSDATATVVAWEQGAVVSVEQDASQVYYSDMTMGRIRRAPKGGDGFQTLAEGLHEPGNLALDATHVYWIDEAHNTGAPMIRRVPKAGGAVEDLVGGQEVALINWARSTQDGLAISGDELFWVDEDQGAVYRAPKNGGAPEKVSEGLKRPTALALRDGFVYVAVNGLDYEGRGILRIPEQGGNATWIVSDPAYVPWEVELGDLYVYWTNPYLTGPVSRACR